MMEGAHPNQIPFWILPEANHPTMGMASAEPGLAPQKGLFSSEYGRIEEGWMVCEARISPVNPDSPYCGI